MRKIVLAIVTIVSLALSTSAFSFSSEQTKPQKVSDLEETLTYEVLPVFEVGTQSAITTIGAIQVMDDDRASEIEREMKKQIAAGKKAAKERKEREVRKKKVLKRTAKELKKVQSKLGKMKKGLDVAGQDKIVYTVGSGGSPATKSFMYHRKSSGYSTFGEGTNQYRLQQRAETDGQGFRTVAGRYCIAVGSGFCSKIGTKIDVVLESGKVLKCVMGDQKADCHTDSSHRYHLSDGSYVEFIVDRSTFSGMGRTMGNVNYTKGFKGKVTKIIVYK